MNCMLESANSERIVYFWELTMTLFGTEEIGHACGTVDRTYPLKC